MAFDVQAIRPGDVLLFHGKGFVSWAIRKFDGTEVNHAAVSLPGGMLGEAGGKGLQSRPVPQPGGGEFIRVHRLRATTELDPVVAKANAFLADGHAYAYQQIVLLAVLTLTRRIPLPRLARRLVRAALDHASTAVMDLLPAGAQWMICSEYVYRSFDGAVDGGDDPYGLAIAGASFGPGPGEATGAMDGILLDWALANVRDVSVLAPVTFGATGPPTDHMQRIASIEADLAPLIVDYAEQLFAAGELTDDDLPPLLDASFGPPAPLPPEPTDDELLASIAGFGAVLGVARGQAPVAADPTFGGVGATIGAAALKGALDGVKTLLVDPNFVTPGDLLRSPSLESIGRLG